MTLTSRKQQVRDALIAAYLNPRQYKWNEVQWRTGTSEENPFGDEWSGHIDDLDYALRTMKPGEVVHVLVYERGEFGDLKDVVTVVLG